MRRPLVLLLLACACTSAPHPAVQPKPPRPAPVSSAPLEDHAGDSTDSAITVPADAPDGGLQFENDWIYDRYGRFRRRGGGTGSLNGRRYNVVKIELPGGEQREVFFDITDNWNKWSGQ